MFKNKSDIFVRMCTLFSNDVAAIQEGPQLMCLCVIWGLLQ